jgi:hypothetical protein
MKVFLLSWLSQLNCLVLNRPTPLCLSGSSWRPEHKYYPIEGGGNNITYYT